VPFVIREKEGQESTFELVGDAYVHGIMDGEEMEKEDVRVEEILLC
jgi:WD repeat-containing protein 55